MGEILIFIVQMSFIVNPILAIVFFINLIEIIKKANLGEEAIDKHVMWVTISGTYIISTITWMGNIQMNM